MTEYAPTLSFLCLNADVVARFHRVWRIRIHRQYKGLAWGSYDSGLETQLHNLCVNYQDVVHAASETFDWRKEQRKAELLYDEVTP